MLKRKFIYLISIIIILIFQNYLYSLNIKNIDKNTIYSNTLSIKEENLTKKEEELINAYNYDDYTNYNLEYSKVLFQNIYNLKNEITIYKGEKQGIRENNLVINKDGLVGIVKKVNEYTSIVSLLTNDNCQISVRVNNSYGILKYKEGSLVIEGINNLEEIFENDVVFTSDIAIYPENIKIGTIKEIDYDKYEIEKILKVSPYVDFNHLNYLSIIKDFRGE